MRKQKLRGGKQAVAGAQEKQPPSKDWKVDLNAASRALALRWLRAARERLEGVSNDDMKRSNSWPILAVSWLYPRRAKFAWLFMFARFSISIFRVLLSPSNLPIKIGSFTEHQRLSAFPRIQPSSEPEERSFRRT